MNTAGSKETFNHDFNEVYETDNMFYESDTAMFTETVEDENVNSCSVEECVIVNNVNCDLRKVAPQVPSCNSDNVNQENYSVSRVSLNNVNLTRN